MRDKNHDGDTHKFFDHLDHDDDEHLTDIEIMTILGADPKKVRGANGLLRSSCSVMPTCACAAEGEKGWNVHEDYGWNGGRDEKNPGQRR